MLDRWCSWKPPPTTCAEIQRRLSVDLFNIRALSDRFRKLSSCAVPDSVSGVVRERLYNQLWTKCGRRLHIDAAYPDFINNDVTVLEPHINVAECHLNFLCLWFSISQHSVLAKRKAPVIS